MEIGTFISLEVMQSRNAVKDGCSGAMEMLVESVIGIGGTEIGFKKEEEEEERGDVDKNGCNFSRSRSGGGEEESCH